MTIKLIKNDADLDNALNRIEVIFDAEEGTAEADERDVLAVLIEVYEDEHYPIDHADPVEAIHFFMEQQCLQPKDLTPYLGSSSRVSEVLSGKRPLSKSMIAKLHSGLKIPLESLFKTGSIAPH